MRLRSESAPSAAPSPSTVNPLACFQKLSRHRRSHCHGTCTVAAYGTAISRASASDAGSAMPPAPSSVLQPRTGSAGPAAPASSATSGRQEPHTDEARVASDTCSTVRHPAAQARAISPQVTPVQLQTTALAGHSVTAPGSCSGHSVPWRRKRQRCHGSTRRPCRIISCARLISGNSPSAMAPISRPCSVTILR